MEAVLYSASSFHLYVFFLYISVNGVINIGVRKHTAKITPKNDAAEQGCIWEKIGREYYKEQKNWKFQKIREEEGGRGGENKRLQGEEEGEINVYRGWIVGYLKNSDH